MLNDIRCHFVRSCFARSDSAFAEPRSRSVVLVTYIHTYLYQLFCIPWSRKLCIPPEISNVKHELLALDFVWTLFGPRTSSFCDTTNVKVIISSLNISVTAASCAVKYLIFDNCSAPHCDTAKTRIV